MATINIANIIAENVNLEIINQAIKQRAQALASQLEDQAADQFISDMSSFESSIECDGTGLVFKIRPSETYLLSYLQSHSTPVSGGDGGQAHNVDGSTYESNVPDRLQGTPLPWYELPSIDGEEEVQQLIKIMAPDAAKNAIGNSMEQIKEKIVIPFLQEELIGGD